MNKETSSQAKTQEQIIFIILDLNFMVFLEESVKIHINNLKRELESGH